MNDFLIPIPFRHPDGVPQWLALSTFAEKMPGYKPAHKAAIDRMCELRRRMDAAVNAKPPAAAGQEPFIQATLLAYANVLAHAQRHLPLTGGADGVPQFNFGWKSAFDGTTGPVTGSSSVNYEIASTLWNVGAAYSWLGSAEVAKGTVDAFKAAFKFFQAAAGAFAAISPSRGPLVKLSAADAAGDLDPSMIEFAVNYSMAQAHHAGYLKAETEMRDKRSLLSKLAADGATLYKSVAASMSRTSPPALVDMVAASSASAGVMTARAHWFVAEDLHANKEIGKALGNVNQALKVLPAGAMRTGIDAWVVAVNNGLVHLHDTLSGLNNTVFFDRVPPTVDEVLPPGRPLGKPTPLPPLLQLTPDPDPFGGLVPKHAVAAVAAFRERLSNELTNVTIAALDSRSRATEMINALGARSVVESILSPANQKLTLPQSLKSKIVTVRNECRSQSGNPASGIVDALVNGVQQAFELGQAVNNLTKEAITELDHERFDDERRAQEYGEKFWRAKRQPSDLLPDVVAIRRSLGEINSTVGKLVSNPVLEVKTLLEANANDVSRLDWPSENLDALMPFPASHEAHKVQSDLLQAAEAIKQLLQRFDQSEVVEEVQLKEVQNALLSDHILAAISSADVEHRDEVLERLDAEVKDRMSVLKAAAASRATIVAEIQAVAEHVAMVRSSDPVAEEAQKVISQIESALSVAQNALTRCRDISMAADRLMSQAETTVGLARNVKQARMLEAEDYAAQLEREIAARAQSTRSAEDSRKRQDAILKEINELEQQRLELSKRQVPTAAAAQQATPFGAQPVSTMSYQPPPGVLAPPPQQQQQPPPSSSGQPVRLAPGQQQQQWPPQQQQQQQQQQQPPMYYAAAPGYPPAQHPHMYMGAQPAPYNPHFAPPPPGAMPHQVPVYRPPPPPGSGGPPAQQPPSYDGFFNSV